MPINSKAIIQASPELKKMIQGLGIPKGDAGNLSRSQLGALLDLSSYMTSGRYKEFLEYSPTKGFLGRSKSEPMSIGDTSAFDEFVKNKADFGMDGIRFTKQSPINDNVDGYHFYTDGKGNIVNTGFDAGLPTVDELDGVPGEATYKAGNRHFGSLRLTSPLTDLGQGYLKQRFHYLPNTIDKSVMKHLGSTANTMIRPGTYLSGDEGRRPIGKFLLDAVDQNKFGNLQDILFTKPKGESIERSGLSPDSYSSIIRQGLRTGHYLRYGEPFYKGNNSAADNKNIYDAFLKYNKKEIPIEEYLNTVNNGITKIGGTEPAFIKDDKVMIPHPYVYYKKQGGILKRI